MIKIEMHPSLYFFTYGNFTTTMKKSKLVRKAKRFSGKPTLKSIRMSKGLTQADVVNMTRDTVFPIPQGTLSSWETAACIPNSNVLLFLAGIYQVSKEEILEGWQNTWEESDYYPGNLEEWQPIFEKIHRHVTIGDDEDIQTELEFEDDR